AIDQQGFTCRTGFWFSPTRYEVRFAEVNSLRYVSDVQRGSRGNQRKYKFILQMKSGGARNIVVGDLMRHAVPAILQAATQAGVDARDET
ncbi:MAG: hypothetical protein L0Y42_02780, partial [Phycisphaerales bacterium]|nr:hypothetical protein [Phycisphaerales bacterium]